MSQRQKLIIASSIAGAESRFQVIRRTSSFFKQKLDHLHNPHHLYNNCQLVCLAIDFFILFNIACGKIAARTYSYAISLRDGNVGRHTAIV